MGSRRRQPWLEGSKGLGRRRAETCEGRRKQGRSRGHREEVYRSRRDRRSEVEGIGDGRDFSSYLLPLGSGGLFPHLTQGATLASISSWAFETADSIPIGDCHSRILELQLQSWRRCTEDTSALPRSTEFVYPFLFHRDQLQKAI